MLADTHYFKPLVHAEGRVLWLISKKFYGNMTQMAKSFRVSRQFFVNALNIGLPQPYSSYLARTHNFHPALLNFEKHLYDSESPKDEHYIDILDKEKIFSKEEKAYIKQGKIIDSVKFITQSDKAILK